MARNVCKKRIQEHPYNGVFVCCASQLVSHSSNFGEVAIFNAARMMASDIQDKRYAKTWIREHASNGMQGCFTFKGCRHPSQYRTHHLQPEARSRLDHMLFRCHFLELFA